MENQNRITIDEIGALLWFRNHVAWNVPVEVEMKYHGNEYTEELRKLIADNMKFVNSYENEIIAIPTYLGITIYPNTPEWTRILDVINNGGNVCDLCKNPKKK